MNVKHGALREAAEGFVCGLYSEVGAALHGRGGERGVQAQMGTVRLIHYKGDAPAVAHLQEITTLSVNL